MRIVSDSALVTIVFALACLVKNGSLEDPCPVGRYSTDPGRGRESLQAPAPALRRILPDLVSAEVGPPRQLRPTWQVRGVARPWRNGAAVPRAGSGADPAHPRRGGTRRGTRAGRRVQGRRCRLIRDEWLRGGAVSRGILSGRGPSYDRALVEVPITAAECDSVTCLIPVCVSVRRPPAARAGLIGVTERMGDPAPARCLTRPARLTERQTCRLAVEGETRATDGATRSPTSRGQLRIGHLNVRSLIPKLGDVMMLLQDQKFDLFCITESWLTPDVMPEFLTFPGYSVLRRDRTRRRGGGVAIIHRTEMAVKVLKMPASGPLETLWAVATWPGGLPITVGVIYRPPNSAVAAGLDHLETQLRRAAGAGRPLFALGDLNFNVLDAASPGTHRYLELINELNLTQLIDGPTHLHPTPSALDHIITNRMDPAPETSILPDAISDHQPIVMTARLPRVRRPARWRVLRNWRRADWSAICLELLLADWTQVDEADDVNSCVEHFMAIWNAAMDRHCPPRRVRVSRPSCPWLEDPDLRALMAERDSARDTWLCLRTPEAKEDFTELRNQVKSKLIAARRQFLCGELTSGGRGGFWPTFKRFAMASPEPAGGAGREDAEKADAFNRYFADVGPRIAADLRGAVIAGREDLRPPTVCSTGFQLTPVTLPELSRCVKKMSASRAVGLDEVPLEAVRQCFAVIGPHLLRLINLSLRTKVFPDSWKTACIVPILKAGDPSVPSNNRPISLLSVLSKILEKVVCSQLTNYLSSAHLFSQSQYAYRVRHSTEDAVLAAVERLVSNTDRGLVSSVTTVDLSKAFDSVDHGVLLTKLSWYGVIDIDWFKSYLCGRGQIVRGGRSCLPMTCGVPQGSILGPILFILFTADLPCYLSSGSLSTYADDTVHLDCASPDENGLTDLKNRLETTVMELQAWFNANSLKMNEGKTDFMLVGSKQNLKKSANFNFQIGDSTVLPAEKVKVLGVIIDSKLTWEMHISAVVQKCNKILLTLYKFRHYFSSDIRKLIIQAYVFPHITYCLCVWASADKGQLQKIQKVINFAARLVTGLKKSQHITPALKSLNWPRIETLVAHRDLIKVFCALTHEDSPAAIRDLFTRRSEVSSRQTRASERGDLHVARLNLTASQRVFSNRAALAWSALPPSVRERATVGAFKAALRDMPSS